MLIVLLRLSTISVWIINFDGAKEKSAWKMLISPQRMKLNSVLFPACSVIKMAWISTSVLFMPYSKLYILTELSANDVKFISVDRKQLDLSKYMYLWYRKFYSCRDTARFYEHKKWRRRNYTYWKRLDNTKEVTIFDQEDESIAPRRQDKGYRLCITINTDKATMLRDYKRIMLKPFEREFTTAFKTKMLKNRSFLALNSHLLINNKIQTSVGILTFISRIHFMLSWVKLEKSVIISEPAL